jgi:asparagine synthase (glutamine-hydrolysing)
MDVRENRFRALLPYSLRKTVFGPLGRIYPKMDRAPRIFRARSTFQSLSFDPLEGYFESVSTFRSDDKPRILSDGMRSTLRGYSTLELFRSHYDRAGNSDLLSRIQYLDIKTYLTDDILTKVDRASMAVSLEVRCPLLDHHLMELVARMPSGLKLKGSTSKYLFKKAITPFLPAQTLHRSKMGFAVPLEDWFRGGIREFSRTYLLDRSDEYLSQDFVRRIWDQHQAGIRDRSAQLWNVLMFRLWLDRFGAGPPHHP